MKALNNIKFDNWCGGKFLKISIVFLIVFSWIFSGFPRIWQNPPIPPKIQEARAAQVTFQAAGTGAASITNPAPGYPSNLVSGYLILLQVLVWDLTTTPTTPTGFTLLYGPDQDGTPEGRQFIYYKFSDGTESGTLTITIGATTGSYARMYSFSNVALSSFTEGGGLGAGSDASIEAVAVTTTDVERLAVSLVAVTDNNTGIDAFAGETGGDWTEAVAEFTSGTGNDGALQLQIATMASAGTISGGSDTMQAADGWIVRAFALKPKPITTLGNGASEPSSATIGPGDPITDLDNFTLKTNVGTDTVTAAVVTLGPADAYNNIAQVDITDTSNFAKCTAVTDLTSNTVTFPASTCNISVTTSETTYKVRITPKTHGSMPPVPGASYATTGTVTDITCTNSTSKNDSGSATITVDNASPSGVTGTSGTAGDANVQLNWTNPVDSDFTTGGQVVVLRRASSAVADVPVEGESYSVGNPIGTAVVACVVSGSPPAQTCTDTGLSNGTAYHYKIFTKDSRGNYDAGTVPTGSPFTPAAAQSLTFSLGANSLALGTLSSTAVTTGSHTFNVATNAAGGMATTVSGVTLTSTGGTIDACATNCTNAGTTGIGTEQFGINLVANTSPTVGAAATGTPPIGSAATNYNTANSFRFVSGETIASSAGAINDTTFTVSYIANISGPTEAGSYNATLTYVATATF